MRTVPSNRLIFSLRDAMRDRHREDVNAIVEELARRRAPLGEQWRSLTEVMLHNRESSLAATAAMLWRESRDSAPLARYEESVLLHRANRIRAALATISTVHADIPDPAVHGYQRGVLLTKLGEFAKAREQFEIAIHARPGFGHCWLALLMLCSLPERAALIGRLNDVVTHLQPAPDPDYAAIAYAQGMALDAAAEYGAAFEAFAKGAAIMARASRHDRTMDSRFATLATAGFSRALIADIGASVATDTTRPILVTGLPRSGTTMVQQILTAHQDVVDGDELGLMGVIAMDVGDLLAHRFGAMFRW